MTELSARVMDEVLRRDLASFIYRVFQTVSPSSSYTNPWYARAIAYQLERCIRGEIKRLIINMPPRYGKSIAASVALVAYLLGLDPTKEILCASYSAELSAKLARDCRTILMSDWFRRAFPGTRLDPKKIAELDFRTTRHGGRYSTSVGGAVTGRGGDWLILDDPMKPEEAMSEARRQNVIQWYDNTLLSRLNDKRNGVIIVIMQRLHIEDLTGHILSKGEDWEVLSLPAIAPVDRIVPIGRGEAYHWKAGEALDPKRETVEMLRAQRAAMGSFNFSAQYLQEPVPEEGELFHWEWFRFYDQPPKDCQRIIQSWDTASKDTEISDYSVCTTWMWRQQEFYLLDVFRKKLTYPDLRQALVQQQQRWKASAVLIEDKGAGISLNQERRRGTLPVPGLRIAIEPVADKVTRAWTISHLIEGGRVHLPRSAHWLDEFRKEVLQFPKGRHDDQIDSMSQALKWASEYRPGVIKVRVSGI